MREVSAPDLPPEPATPETLAALLDCADAEFDRRLSELYPERDVEEEDVT